MSRNLQMQHVETSRKMWFYKTQRNTRSASSGIERFPVATEQENEAIFRAASVPLSYNRGHGAALKMLDQARVLIAHDVMFDVTAPELEQFLTTAWAACTVTPRVAAMSIRPPMKTGGWRLGMINEIARPLVTVA
ncbi:hypothetical protein BJ742DRAFT_743353 [Cladochytrium replicatum]|nr:hypothetical protein BJ742DRAFT_743353 [Cladochytrium replicatum]